MCLWVFFIEVFLLFIAVYFESIKFLFGQVGKKTSLLFLSGGNNRNSREGVRRARFDLTLERLGEGLGVDI